MTQRFWILFKESNSLVWIRLKESDPFLNVTQKLKFFVWKKIKNWSLSKKLWLKELTLFSKNESKSVFLLKKIWFEEWNLLENMTFKQKTWLKELNSFYFDSENWFFWRLKELNFSSNMAQRIELFFCLVWVKELVFS